MQALKEINKCRGQKVGPYHPNGSRFCPNCKHLALTDIEGLCLCCKIKIPKRKQITKLKVFDKILESCGLSIQEWIADPCNTDYNFGWCVRIGIINYFVPVRYLAEYMEMPNLEG